LNFQKTEARLIEYTKQVQVKDQEIQKLMQTINELNKNVDNLNEELNKNHSAIEDLEFQLEEHKLGLTENEDQSEPNAKETGADELTHLRDLVRVHTQEIDKLKANEKNLLDERDEIFRNLEMFEEKIRMSQAEIDENSKLKQILKDNEVNIKFLTDETEKLRFLCDENDIKKFELESKLKEYEEEKSKMEQTVKKLEIKNIQVQGLHDELKQQMQLTEKQVESNLKNSFNEKMRELEVQIEQHKMESIHVDSLNEKILLANQNIEDLNKQISDQEKTNGDLVRLHDLCLCSMPQEQHN
jgi:chromosome segregation ATPase